MSDPSTDAGPSPAVEVRGLSHWYGEKQALNAINFSVNPGEAFAFLGPNGSGKSTLFSTLSTLINPMEGELSIFGMPMPKYRAKARQSLGVLFQHPGLDPMLSVEENLKCHGYIYGLSGQDLGDRISTTLDWLGLADRRGDRVGTLSGGLARRAELAKVLLHKPRLLLLDEPSNGLDPAARIALWKVLHQLRRQTGLTLLVTTHLLPEAEDCDRIALLDQGKLIALDTPMQLKANLGGHRMVLRSANLEDLAQRLKADFDLEALLVGPELHINDGRAPQLVAPIMESLGAQIESLTIARPTLEDVFIRLTGHAFITSSEVL